MKTRPKIWHAPCLFKGRARSTAKQGNLHTCGHLGFVMPLRRLHLNFPSIAVCGCSTPWSQGQPARANRGGDQRMN